MRAPLAFALVVGILVVVVACATAARFRSQPLDPACLAAVDFAAPMPHEVRRCDGVPVVAFGGERPLGGDELLAFKDAHARAWLELDPRAHMTVGLGGCCVEGGPNVTCLHISYNACTVSDDALLARIEADLAAALPGASVLALVERARPVRPQPRDVAASWPVHTFDGHMSRFSGGACHEDGDCTVHGCGNHCLPWNEPPFMATCEGYRALEGAECGCHDAQCTWLK